MAFIGSGKVRMLQWQKQDLVETKRVLIILTEQSQEQNEGSLLVEADGGPLAVVIGGANVHDCKLLEVTLEAIVVERPNPQNVEQHLCLDKGYDNPTGRDAVDQHQYIPHIRRIGEEKFDEQQ